MEVTRQEMGCTTRDFLHAQESAVPNSLGDALLFTTVCIIGLPVDVHVKDGSIYSGIFHTACVENDYGIVLKKARMTKKGNCAANVANWDLIETLVVLSEDLVQVVAKGIPLPGDGDDIRDIAGTVRSIECADRGIKLKTSYKSNADRTQTSRTRQVGDDRSQGKEFDYEGRSEFQTEGTAREVQGSGRSLDAGLTQSKAVEEIHKDTVVSKMIPKGAASSRPASSVVKPNDQCQERYTSEDCSCSNAVSLGVSTSATSCVEVTTKSRVNSSPIQPEMVPPKRSSSASKEFKLNPGAKIFCPSFANHRSVTPPAVATVASVAYVPDNFPVVPIASPQQEVEISPFVPRSSLPVKYASYGNLIASNGVSDSQYSQSMIGHVGSRTQSNRFAGQHHSIQAAYMHPNSQNVMVGRLGQLVYMHPVSHDVNQGVAAFPQVSTRPLLTPHQGHLPKHQGNAAAQALQLCVTPPHIAGGQQLYTVQTHVPLPQPTYPVIRPIPIPGSNGIFNTKFP